MFFKKTKSSLAVAILFVLSLGLAVKPAMSVNADQIPFGVTKNFYHVRFGDNLWDLAGKLYGDNNKWKKLAEDNGLKEKVFTGPQGLFHLKQEYCPLDTAMVLVYYTPDTAGITPTPNPKNGASIPPAPIDFGNGDEIAKWFWIIVLTLAFLFILYKILSARRKNKESDPVGSGQPQVEGGVDEAHALQRVQTIANANGINPLRVTNIQLGRFYGRARVFYADKPLGMMKRFDGEIGYRGIVLRTNGEEQTIYFLQGCGNDARVGNFMTGIRFVANETQPTEFVNHNTENQIPIEVPTTETTNVTALTPASRPFNWQEEYLKIIDKAVDGDKKIFFEVTVGSAKVRFNSTGKNPIDTQSAKG